MSGPHRTPSVDIYTALLVIALVAIILATIFAYLETADYGDNKFQGAPSVVRAPSIDCPGGVPGRMITRDTTPHVGPFAANATIRDV